MMDKRSRKELIAGIRDSLGNFEERYDRSEWERFQRQRKNKHRNPVPLFVKLAGIAASLFLMVYASVRFLPFFEGDDDAGKPMPKVMPHLPKENKQEAPDTLAVDSMMPVVRRDIRDVHDSAGPPVARQHPFPLAAPIRNDDGAVREEADIRKVATHIGNTGALAGPSAKGQPLKRVPLQKRPNQKLGTAFSSVEVGVNLTPAFTNKGFALGGGVSARIPLSSRISTEVGVSYMNLKVGKDMEADRTDTVSLQTVGIRNAVGMVALPVSVNYTFTEYFSAALGLVPFRVVSDRRTDIRQSFRWVSGDVLSGDTTGRLVSEKTRSRRADSLYRGNTYLGFIQVSGQFSPPLLRKRNMVVAPFVAIPVGRLKDDEYRWLHGGVSIRITF